jgi:hypothetical protein
MFDFTFSGRIPKKNTKTSFLRLSLIPEQMEWVFSLKSNSLRRLPQQKLFG